MYDAVISARDYDFFAENVLTMQFSAMPARTQLTYTPTSGCKYPAGLSTTQARSKYGFIATTVGRPEFIAGFWKSCGIRNFNGANFGKLPKRSSGTIVLVRSILGCSKKGAREVAVLPHGAVQPQHELCNLEPTKTDGVEAIYGRQCVNHK